MSSVSPKSRSYEVIQILVFIRTIRTESKSIRFELKCTESMNYSCQKQILGDKVSSGVRGTTTPTFSKGNTFFTLLQLTVRLN